MIGSEPDALVDQYSSEHPPMRLGGPFTILALLMMVWIGGRAALWEDPLKRHGFIAQAAQLLAQAELGEPGVGMVDFAVVSDGPPPAFDRRDGFGASADQGPSPALNATSADLASGHHALWNAALTMDSRGRSWRARRHRFEDATERQASVPVFPGTPPFVTDPKDQTSGVLNRWSLGAWAFVRQGSRSAAVTAGPAPVYGASQMGAILLYHIAPSHRRHPRAYLRATRSLLTNPESELALGLSARPLSQFPMRVAAEVRGTDNEFGRDLRPAAFAITELPPIDLPLDFGAEVYAAAGYVGGKADTAFFDGQAAVMRGLANFDLRRVDDVRVSLGAGAWGGAQRDAHRVDVGPTMRIDMALGSVPARVSIDYRERVGGDATPTSGVAATFSTQF